MDKTTNQSPSINDLSDDIWHLIVSYLPKIEDLNAFSRSHKRANHFINIAPESAEVFSRLWSLYYPNCGNRHDFLNLHHLSRLAATQTETTGKTSRLQILSPRDEAAALRYDNTLGTSTFNAVTGTGNAATATVPVAASTEANPNSADTASLDWCLGYFGMEQLWVNGPIAVHGDFDGIRILVDGYRDLFRPPEQRQVLSVADDESQVLAILPEKRKQKGSGSHVAYLACSSGCLICIQLAVNAKHPASEPKYNVSILSKVQAHKNEVTSLCWHPEGHLVSASVDCFIKVFEHKSDGKAKIDGNSDKGNLKSDIAIDETTSIASLDDPIDTLAVGSPVLSVDAIRFRGKNFLVSVDQDRNVTLWWLTPQNEASNLRPRPWHFSYAKAPIAIPTQVVFWKFRNESLFIISGDNRCQVTTFRVDDVLELECTECQLVAAPQNGDKEKSVRPVDCLKVYGNLLLIGAGHQVTICKLPDTAVSDHPQLLGSLPPLGSNNAFPPTSKTCDNDRLLPNVISVIPFQQQRSILSLCRDGTMQTWFLGLSKEREKLEEQYNFGGDCKPKAKTAVIVKQERQEGGVIIKKEKEETEDVTNISMLSNFAPPPPPTVASAQESMSKLDEVMASSENRLGMTMRIIQAAYLYSKGSIDSTFPGIGSNSETVFDNVPGAFDKYSTLGCCSSCEKQPQRTPYQCRLLDCHQSDLPGDDDGGYPSRLFLFLLTRNSQSKIGIRRSLLTNGWVCHGCGCTNKANGRRCFLCHRWKGGIRQKFSQAKKKSPLLRSSLPLTDSWNKLSDSSKNATEKKGSEITTAQKDKVPAAGLKEDSKASESSVKDENDSAPNEKDTAADLDTTKKTLDDIMNDGSATVRQSMSMRIVQAAYLYSKNKVNSFPGLNNNVSYDNIPEAFDKHGGILACAVCNIKKSVGPYQCRVVNGHIEELVKDNGGSFQSKLLDKLLKSQKVNSRRLSLTGWLCSGCFSTNGETARRCFLCSRWKDGKHPLPNNASKEKNKKRQQRIPPSVSLFSAVNSINFGATQFGGSDGNASAAIKAGSESTDGPANLDNDMAMGDTAFRLSMIMRIIQAAYLHSKGKIDCFPGTKKNVVYGDIPTAFNKYSTLKCCAQCKEIKERGPYQCRVLDCHGEGLDGGYPSQLLLLLTNSQKLSARGSLEGWLCHDCWSTNKPDARRCFLCNRWKGGKRRPVMCQKSDSDEGLSTAAKRAKTDMGKSAAFATAPPSKLTAVGNAKDDGAWSDKQKGANNMLDNTTKDTDSSVARDQEGPVAEGGDNSSKLSTLIDYLKEKVAGVPMSSLKNNLQQEHQQQLALYNQMQMQQQFLQQQFLQRLHHQQQQGVLLMPSPFQQAPPLHATAGAALGNPTYTSLSMLLSPPVRNQNDKKDTDESEMSNTKLPTNPENGSPSVSKSPQQSQQEAMDITPQKKESSSDENEDVKMPPPCSAAGSNGTGTGGDSQEESTSNTATGANKVADCDSVIVNTPMTGNTTTATCTSKDDAKVIEI